jgi:hypothetical protein
MLAISLFVFSLAICAQQADPCGGLVYFALGVCRANQQKLQQQQQEQQEEQFQQQQQQLQQQQERQAQQDQQQKQIQEQQLENLRLQNEILRKQLAGDQSTTSSHQEQGPQVNAATSPEFQSWLAANPWFASDRAKREFAMLYAKQLKQDRPDLTGRAFLDAVSAKTSETFGVAK